MAATLILWGHSLSALVFVAVAAGTRSHRPVLLPGRALTAALVLTALWALAVAGIDARDVATRLAGAMRDIAWLIALMAWTVGLPFLAVAATAPLIQRWFADSGHAAAGDPYFLYGASNLGTVLEAAPTLTRFTTSEP